MHSHRLRHTASEGRKLKSSEMECDESNKRTTQRWRVLAPSLRKENYTKIPQRRICCCCCCYQQQQVRRWGTTRCTGRDTQRQSSSPYLLHHTAMILAYSNRMTSSKHLALTRDLLFLQRVVKRNEQRSKSFFVVDISDKLPL